MIAGRARALIPLEMETVAGEAGGMAFEAQTAEGAADEVVAEAEDVGADGRLRTWRTSLMYPTLHYAIAFSAHAVVDNCHVNLDANALDTPGVRGA